MIVLLYPLVLLCLHLYLTSPPPPPTHTQSSQASLKPTPLSVNQERLDQFYMTDSISRSSLTMAKCVSAVKADSSE